MIQTQLLKENIIFTIKQIMRDQWFISSASILVAQMKQRKSERKEKNNIDQLNSSSLTFYITNPTLKNKNIKHNDLENLETNLKNNTSYQVPIKYDTCSVYLQNISVKKKKMMY